MQSSNRHPATIAIVAALALSACGKKQETEQPGAQQASGSSGGLFARGPKIEPAKATVDFEVVNIRPGMTSAEIKKKLETDGWRMTTSQGNVISVPGVDDYELPASQTWFRAVDDGALWRGEMLKISYTTALPKEDAQAYQLSFTRNLLDQEPTAPNMSGAVQITPQYTIDTFGALKSKYGEPTSMREDVCNTYDGSVSHTVPTYHLEYARGADNPQALTADVAQGCRQALYIQAQDNGLNKQQNERLSSFRNAQYQKESDKASSKKADF